MFLGEANKNFDIVSVLKLGWDKRDALSADRPFHALSFRLKGNARFVYPEGSIPAGTNDIVFVPRYFDYTLQAEDEELICVHMLSDKPLPMMIKTFTPENPQYFARKFQELYSVWSGKRIGYEYECKAILYKIITTIEREMAETNPSVYSKISEAIEYIHDNFTNGDISVSSLAEMCHMSDTYFRRLFVEKTSVTPAKYINALRLGYAFELLKSKYFNIREVSEKCGFKTVSYFSEFIKKETGVSPSNLYKQL